MTPEQARLLVRQAFREQDLTLQIIREADPKLVWLLRRLAGQIQALPDPGDLMREREWRKLRPTLFAALDQYSASLGADVIGALKGEMQRSEEFARGYVQLGAEKATTSVTIGVNQVAAVPTFVMGKEIGVTTGNLYFRAISEAGVAGQSFAKVFGVSVDDVGGILTVGQERTGMARFFMTSIDRLVTQGILEGRDTGDIVHDLIFESIKGGLNLGKSGKLLKSQATTVVRTGIADALARSHEAFWDANNDWEWDDPETGEHHQGKVIQGWMFDAITDSRVCENCAMWDQKYAPDRDDLPSVPLHPRCRCVRRPITATERELMKQDAAEARRREKAGLAPKTAGTAIELVEEKDLPRRKGESATDFIRRQQGKRRAANQDGRDLPERWYATPVRKGGKTFWRKAVDLPTVGRDGIRRVPEWLAGATTATQVDFFGGGGAGATRQRYFQQLIAGGKSPREAMVAMLSADKQEGFKHWQFKPVKDLASK